MARGGGAGGRGGRQTPLVLSKMGAPIPAKALRFLLLTFSAGCLLSTTTAQIAEATTTTAIANISLCGEESGTTMPCPDPSLDSPASTGPPGGPGRGLVGIPSAAPTPSPTLFANASVVAECEEESEECLADEECQGCYEIASGLSSSVEFEACREAYLGVAGGGSTSSSSSPSPSLSGSDVELAVSSSTCDVAGAMYCCSNEISESDCLAGDKSSLYWGCVFESYGCELEEVACLDVLGESYRSDDDDVGGRASSSPSGAGRSAGAPWSSGAAGGVVVAGLGLAAAVAAATSVVVV